MAQVKLTPFSKLLIVVALAVGAYFLLRNYIPALNPDANPTTTETVDNYPLNDNQTADNTNTQNNSNVDNTTRNNNEVPANFTYTPPAPVNGKLKGVVELGASGFNSFIVTMDNQKRWKLEKADWGNSLVYDGMSSVQDIRNGLKNFIGGMLDYGVSGRDIHFVVSSGAQKVDATQKIIRELKGMNYVVNTVTPEQEGRYALQASLPRNYYGSAYMVDIGSGNTKISWTDGSVKALETYGAKYYRDNVPDSKVYQDVRATAAKIPRDRRKICFLLGGVPFQMAKQVRQGEERYTVLREPDFYKADGAKMKAGLNIYNALRDGTDTDTFVFDWEGNFTIGFLLSL